MRISFSTAALYPRDSLEALSLIAKAGVKEAELMPQCTADLSPAFAKEAAKILHVSSIHYPLCMFGVLYNSHRGMAKEAKALNTTLIEAARIMGTEVIVIHPHTVSYHAADDPELLKLLYDPIIENFIDMADKAAQHNITITVENNPRTEGPTPEKLVAYVESLNHPQIKTIVDTTEAVEAGIDPTEFIRVAKPSHTHLSDHKDGLRHINVGEGIMDWASITAELKAQQYNGIYVLEPSYKYYLCDDAEAAAKIEKSKNYLLQFA